MPGPPPNTPNNDDYQHHHYHHYYSKSTTPTSRPGGTVGWLWNLRSDGGVALELVLRVDNKETAVPGSIPAHRLPRCPGPDPPGAPTHSRIRTQDIIAEGQQPSSRRRNPGSNDLERKPPPDLPVYSQPSTSRARPDAKGTTRMSTEVQHRPTGAAPATGHPGAEGATLGFHKTGLDETLGLGDSDWRLPPDQPVYPSPSPQRHDSSQGEYDSDGWRDR